MSVLLRRCLLRPYSSTILPSLCRCSRVSLGMVSTYSSASAVPSPGLRTQPETSEILRQRLEAVRNARPFSDLTDIFQRQHTFLRISITERCNLRFLYCMPEEGVPLTPDANLLTAQEILHIAKLFVMQGVTKIRLTWGEPSTRKDIVDLVAGLGRLKPKGLKEIAISSNGIALARKLEKLVAAGVASINVSLDTLEAWKFEIMTRRKGFQKVMETIDMALRIGLQPIKVNCVVMRTVNDDEILKFVEMTRDKPIEVKFIEYMPFDSNKWNVQKMVPYAEILEQIKRAYPEISPAANPCKNDTSRTYQIPGFVGQIGFITSMTHNFCGTCNRLRITSDGNLKACLFGNGEGSLKVMMRTNDIRKEIVLSGGEVDRIPCTTLEKECLVIDQEMLDVIGVAVKGKRAKHAGMENLEHMKNRPMILIGDPILNSISWNRASTPIHLPIHRGFSSYPHQTRMFSTKAPLPTNQAQTIQTPPTTCSIGAPLTPGPPSPIPASVPTISSQLGPSEPHLPHLTASGSAHMVSITGKQDTLRLATATATVYFSNPSPYQLISTSTLKKGDALSVARIAGIMAAKNTPLLIPLCHPILLEGINVDVKLVPPASPTGNTTSLSISTREQTLDCGSIQITARVCCLGKTGVEMEALCAASIAGLAIYDMCKAVDKGMWMESVRVIEKKGGRSGDWVRDDGGEVVNTEKGYSYVREEVVKGEKGE